MDNNSNSDLAIVAFRKALLGLSFDHYQLTRFTRWPISKQEGVSAPAAAVSASTFYVGDGFLDFSPAEQRGVALHEILHVLRAHLWRGLDSRNPDLEAVRFQCSRGEYLTLLNVAADYIVNLDVLAAGETLPPTALLDPDYAGLSLTQAVQKCFSTIPKPQEAPSAADWGKLVPTDAADADADAALDTAFGGYSETEAAEAIAQIVQCEPPITLDVLMRKFTVYGGRDRRSDWTRPSRFGPLVPGHRRYGYKVLVLLVDTSGSITRTTQELFCCLARGLPDAAVVHVVFADTRVRNRVENITNPYEVQFAWGQCAGGGGTDLHGPLDSVKRDYHPSNIVYFTDGICQGPPLGHTDGLLWVVRNDDPLKTLPVLGDNHAVRVNAAGIIVEERR